MTSVSVLGIKIAKAQRQPTKEKRSEGNENFQKLSIRHLIAVGGANGMIQLYDSLGLLVNEIATDQDADRVISVEWIKGPSPKALPTRKTKTVSSAHHHQVPITGQNQQTKRQRSKHILEKAAGEGIETSLSAFGKPIPSQGTFNSPSPTLPVMIDAIPAEDLGTVRRIPSPIKDNQPHSPHVRFAYDPVRYIDLFTPNEELSSREQQKKRFSRVARAGDETPRHVLVRPRLSSQTFTRNQDTVHVDPAALS